MFSKYNSRNLLCICNYYTGKKCSQRHGKILLLQNTWAWKIRNLNLFSLETWGNQLLDAQQPPRQRNVEVWFFPKKRHCVCICRKTTPEWAILKVKLHVFSSHSFRARLKVQLGKGQTAASFPDTKEVGWWNTRVSLEVLWNHLAEEHFLTEHCK